MPNPRPDLRPKLEVLQGVRALACLAITLGHVTSFTGLSTPQDHIERFYARIDEVPWLAAVIHLTEVGIDALMVLTGFLAILSLIPALQQASCSGTSLTCSVTAYYAKRALRIFPEHYIVLTMISYAIIPLADNPALSQDARHALFSSTPFLFFSAKSGACPRSLAASALFVQNWLSIDAQCASWLWSSSVQVQFYLIAPLTLCALRPGRPGFTARVRNACALIFGVVAVYRAAVVAYLISYRDFRTPLAAFGPLAAYEGRANNLIDHVFFSYQSLFSRLQFFAAGGSAAALLYSPQTTALLARRPHRVFYFLCAISALNLPGFYNQGMFQLIGLPDFFGPVQIPNGLLIPGYVWATGVLPSAGIAAFLLFLTLPFDNYVPQQQLVKVLSSAPLACISGYSYGIFLLHPIVATLLFGFILPPAALFARATWIVFPAWAVITGITLAMSAVLDRLISASIPGRGTGGMLWVTTLARQQRAAIEWAKHTAMFKKKEV